MTNQNTQNNVTITITGKGGVGKSTVTQELATALAQAGHQVTVVEMDEQGSISRRLGITAPATISDVLLGKVAPLVAARPTPCGFALIAADDTLEDAVKELDRPGARSAVMTLKTVLRTVPGIIIIDTLPQQADFCTESALVAANLVATVAGLYQNYVTYCVSQGREYETNIGFGRQMVSKGYKSEVKRLGKGSAERCYAGIALRE